MDNMSRIIFFYTLIFFFGLLTISWSVNDLMYLTLQDIQCKANLLLQSRAAKRTFKK